MNSCKLFTASLCVFLMAVPPTWAQTDEAQPWHHSFTKNYRSREIEPINLVNSNRLESLIRAGKIYLSLQDAVALALENNLDIELQRYGPRIAEADLLRAQAGGLLRGIPQNVQQGAQSAVNLQTGTSAGSGSFVSGGSNTAGSSASGTIITSTGTAIPILDETIYGNVNWGHRTVIQSNSFATGVPALIFRNDTYAFGIRRGFLSGTTVDLGYGSAIQQSNNARAEINPVSNGNVNITVTQRLLQGFGFAVNSRNIRIARNDLKISDLVFKQQVIATVASIVNLYSDLVSFNEDLKVRRQALALNEKLYNDNRKQVEIGTLAPIEIVRAEAEVARSQQELTASETQLLQQETIIKNALSRTGVSNPLLAEARIVPTDLLSIPDVEAIQPIQDLVETAVKNRPELEQTKINIDNAKISLHGSRSQLLPSLDLVASAANNGLAGQVNTVPLPDAGTGFIRQANPAFLGGLGSVWTQIFGRNYPDYSVGFSLNVPLRNRSARADVIRDELTLRQSEIRQRQQLNQIRVDVQNALIGLQQARARYLAAQKARNLAEQTLDAEQKKYSLGASTIFFVIQAQRDLAQAQASEVSALSAYNRSRVSMDVATGQTLSNNNISLQEAREGRVSTPPSVLPVVDQP